MKIEFERMLMPVSKYSGMYVQDLHGYKVEKKHCRAVSFKEVYTEQ